MQRQVGAFEFLLRVEAQADHGLDRPIDDGAADQRHGNSRQRADHLRPQADTTDTTQRPAAEDARRDAAPRATQAVQGPDAEHIVYFPAVLRQREHMDEQGARDTPHRQRPDRVHQVGAGAHGHQPRQRTVVHETRVIATRRKGRQGTAHHGHQRIQGDQAIDRFHALRAHHIEAEPAHGEDPGAEREEGNARGRMRGNATVLLIAPAPRPQQQHRGQGDPATDGVHHDASRKIVERYAKSRLQPCLESQVAVPDDAFEERIDQANDQEGCQQLGHEARPLGDAAGDDCRNRRGESQQEEELHQLVTRARGKLVRAMHEAAAVGNGVADEEIGDGRYREVRKNFDQGVDLILLADRSDFEKGESRMHREHHDGAQQDKQDIVSDFDLLHIALPMHDGGA